jgi:PAS domain S-box-containing protein
MGTPENKSQEELLKLISSYKFLLDAEKTKQSIFENMLEGLQVIGFDWKYIYVNNAVVKQGKRTKDQLIGHTMMQNYPGIEKTGLFTALRQCMELRLPQHFENKFTFPDESIGWFELSIQPVSQGIMILSMDITDRKKAEEALKKLNEELETRVQERTTQLHELNKELESYTYTISHDLRAPLRALHGFSQILEEDYESVVDEEGKELLKGLRNNAVKMDNLICDLLEFSRLGRKEIRKGKINMKILVENAALDHKTAYPHNAEIEINNLHDIEADATLIKQVVTNLLSNAIKYSVHARTPKVEISSIIKDGFVIYSVQDNGVGFDMKYSDKLFGVFQKLHSEKEFEGSGIGLAIVQRIIKKHGGKVWADAKPNDGAAFYFSLPLDQTKKT